MKKIFLLFICSIFITSISFGQLQDDSNGTVSVDVIKHLELVLTETDVMFTYNEHGTLPTSTNSDWNQVKVKANVDWTLDVGATNGETVLTNVAAIGSTIDADKIKFYLTIDNGTVFFDLPAMYPFSPSAVIPPHGKLNAEFKMYWDLAELSPENLYSGDYKIGVTYTLIEGLPTP